MHLCSEKYFTRTHAFHFAEQDIEKDDHYLSFVGEAKNKNKKLILYGGDRYWKK